MPIELTILMPCLNESLTIATCIQKAKLFLGKYNVEGEILVADNGSTDGSQSIVKNQGANCIHVPEKGYGSALIAGIEASRGKYIIMGDADDSYDFSALENFLDQLRNGNDLVMGNRFAGGIRNGAMPFLHRYLGNPVLSFIGRCFFKTPIGDFHCGLRGFSKDAALKMNLKCTGMEFASEMVVKASLLDMEIVEVPTILSKDGRDRPPHLRTWRDGWRHLRFLLMYSPTWLFLYPGFLLMLLGIITSAFLIAGPVNIGWAILDVHTLLYTSLCVILGFQFVAFFIFTKIFAVKEGLLPVKPDYTFISKRFNLEAGLILGILFVLMGLILSYKALNIWNQRHFGSLNTSYVLRWVIPACTFLIIGVQSIIYSFFISILNLSQKSN